MTVTESRFLLINSLGWPIRGDVRWSQALQEVPRRALVLSHGFKGFKDWGHFPWAARVFADAGMVTVTFNFAGNGIGDSSTEFTELDRFHANTLTREVEDLEQVLDAFGSGELPGPRPSKRDISLLGHSRGALASTVAASRRPDIRALVAWAGVGVLADRYPDAIRRQWRADGALSVVNSRTGQLMPIGLDALEDLEDHLLDYSPEHLAADLSMPHLLIHGDADTSVPVSESAAVANASGGRARLEIIPGADHTFGCVHPFSGETAHLRRALDVTIAFLEDLRGA